jgi:hypothetical protein
MAVVQTIGKPNGAQTFGDLADVFVRNINTNIQAPCTRVDVVFDCYNEHSIKNATRKRRAGKGRGIRREISNRDVKLPAQWKTFIDLNENKKSLTKFLKTELLRQAPQGDIELIVSGGCDGTASSSTGRDLDHLCSTQEEADTRMVLHICDAKSTGYERVVVSCSDTDVLVILVAFYPQLSRELWMKAGTSKHRRYIAVHEIECNDGVRDSLLGFHAITGCDTVSQFFGISKKSAWKVFSHMPHLLLQLGVAHSPGARVLAKAEEFVCRLYDPTSATKSIHTQRCSQFRKGKGILDNLPPTQDALLLHIRRAHYQALVWRNSTVANPELPNPQTSGWCMEQDKLLPVLMTKKGLSAECVDIMTCGCPETGRHCQTFQCKCKRSKLKCTGACKCTEWCQNPYNIDIDLDSD